VPLVAWPLLWEFFSADEEFVRPAANFSARPADRSLRDAFVLARIKAAYPPWLLDVTSIDRLDHSAFVIAETGEIISVIGRKSQSNSRYPQLAVPIRRIRQIKIHPHQRSKPKNSLEVAGHFPPAPYLPKIPPICFVSPGWTIFPRAMAWHAAARLFGR
jgi:hypothetical protein